MLLHTGFGEPWLDNSYSGTTIDTWGQSAMLGNRNISGTIKLTDLAVAGESITNRKPFTVKSLLVPLLTRPRVAKFIKYTVYLSLVVNFGYYLAADYIGYRAALPDDAALSDIVQSFATTIDTIAWLGLVFLFELETHSLPDEAFDGWIPGALHIARTFCYVAIAYAAFGYTAETLEKYDVRVIDGVNSACDLADQGVSQRINVVEYVEITSANCRDLGVNRTYYRMADEVSIIDEKTMLHVRWLGWVDIVNAFFWIIVVLLIEVEVWLQNTDRFSGKALTRTRQAKTFFYLVLILNCFIWAFTEYWVYTWDAFLWIFGFWAIELNLAEWEQERVKELNRVPGTS